MISLKNVTKYYKTLGENKYILKNVTLEIPSGKNIGILGRNGMGKSTLLKMLAGIDFPNSGEIYSPNSFSWVMALSKGLQSAMSGRQNVKFICRLYGKSEKQIHSICGYVKEFSEVGDYFEMPIELYSNGMKSRLSFALSMAFDFDYLIIDEILSVGDASFQEKSKKALRHKMRQCNILIVSHSMETLKEFCDAGLVVHNGELHYHDHIDEAIRYYFDLNNEFEPDQNTIYTSDGKAFKNLKDVVSYYGVTAVSIAQAIAHNFGSHLFLKIVFAKGEKKFEPFQANPLFKIIDSNGTFYRDENQVSKVWMSKDAELTKEEILSIFENENKILEKHNMQFYYTSELLNEKN